MRHMILPEPFYALYINLANDVEEVEFYRLSESRRIASMGGASAWHIYKQIREIYPQLSHSAPTVQSFQ